MGFLKDRYFGTSGRLNRQRYILRVCELCVVSLALALGFGYAFGWQTVLGGATGFAASTYSFINWLWQVVVFWAGIHLMTRRLHDFNRSGWWQLIFVFPGILFTISVLMVGIGGVTGAVGSHTGKMSFEWGLGLGIFTVILAIIAVAAQFYIWFKRGTVGPNDYGPDPLAEPAAEEPVAVEPEAITETKAEEPAAEIAETKPVEVEPQVVEPEVVETEEASKE